MGEQEAASSGQPVPVSITMWRDQLLEGERVDEDKQKLPKLVIKDLLVRIQALCMQEMQLAMNASNEYCTGCDLIQVEVDESQKKTKCTLRQTRCGSSELPAWGRVVEENVALHLPRHLVLPIMVCDEQGETVYRCFVEGSLYANPNRNDCCLAWHVLTERRKGDEQRKEDQQCIED